MAHMHADAAGLCRARKAACSKVVLQDSRDCCQAFAANHSVTLLRLHLSALLAKVRLRLASCATRQAHQQMVL